MADYNKKINIKNKRAAFDYEILEEYVAGIVLTGTEIKSLRLGKASMVDCYCYFDRHELYIRGLNISEYHWGTYNNHQPKRDRKLLLNRRELDKLERASQDKSALPERAGTRQGGDRACPRAQTLRQTRIHQGEGCPAGDGPRHEAMTFSVVPCRVCGGWQPVVRNSLPS